MGNYDNASSYGFDLQIKFIKDRMKEKNIKLYQLAELVGVNQSTLVRNFKKDTEMYHSTFLKICGALEINPFLIPKELTREEIFERIYFN